MENCGAPSSCLPCIGNTVTGGTQVVHLLIAVSVFVVNLVEFDKHILETHTGGPLVDRSTQLTFSTPLAANSTQLTFISTIFHLLFMPLLSL